MKDSIVGALHDLFSVPQTRMVERNLTSVRSRLLACASDLEELPPNPVRAAPFRRSGGQHDDEGGTCEAEACDPVPRRGQPVPVAVAVPGAEAVIKAACVFAAVTVAAAWELTRLFRELERALTIREGW